MGDPNDTKWPIAPTKRGGRELFGDRKTRSRAWELAATAGKQHKAAAAKPKPKTPPGPAPFFKPIIKATEGLLGRTKTLMAQAKPIPKPAGQFDIGPVNVKQPGYLKGTILWQKPKKAKRAPTKAKS